MNYSKQITTDVRYLVSTAVLAALAACGGGGGGGGASTTTITGGNANASQNTTVPIVTVAPSAPTYAPSSEELAAYNAINTARTTCGFGYLQQNTLLDTAALNHITWMVDNNTLSHYEVANTPAYTGVLPANRFTSAGYTNLVNVGEDIATLSNTARTGYGLTGTRQLLAVPYHLTSLMQGNREIGLSVKTGGALASGADITYSGATANVFLVADMASSTTLQTQQQSASAVLTYPCQGVTGTAYQMTNESPSPIPARNFASSPAGQSVFVQVAAGQTLVITSSSIVTTIGSNPVPIAVTLTSANDPNGMLTANQAVILPNVPLATNTEYTVTVQGTNNGALFLVNFTFTTGS